MDILINSGWWSGMSLVVYGFIWLIFLLIFLGVYLSRSSWLAKWADMRTSSTATERQKQQLEHARTYLGLGKNKTIPEPPKITTVTIAAIVAFVVIWLGPIFIPPFFEFNRVVVDSQNNWILKNGLGVSVGKIASTTPRGVKRHSFTRTFYNSARTVELQEVVIFTDKAVYHSTASTDFAHIQEVYKQIDNQVVDTMYLVHEAEPRDWLWTMHSWRNSILLGGSIILIIAAFVKKK